MRVQWGDHEGQVAGSGEGLLLRKATVRAFAEAWERAFLKLCSKGAVGPDRVEFSSSNGFAAGPTDEDAVASAFGEFVERATMLAAWTSRRGWQPYRHTSLIDRVLLSSLRQSGWLPRSFLLETTDGHKTLTIFGEHAEFGVVFDCVYAGRDSVPNASVARRLVTSLGRMAMFASREPILREFELPEVGEPLDHRRFYKVATNRQAFDFLATKECQAGFVDLAPFAEVQTRLLHPAAEFPAVAVAYQPHFPTLKWGLASISGGNSWPHPLA